MQLKEFSFISPVLESTEVFKAIGTVIPPDVIAKTIGMTDSLEGYCQLEPEAGYL
jgi:hypothetical protein